MSDYIARPITVKEMEDWIERTWREALDSAWSTDATVVTESVTAFDPDSTSE